MEQKDEETFYELDIALLIQGEINLNRQMA